MKKLLYPAAVALLMGLAATDSMAQNNRTYGGGSNSQRPIPTNEERTGKQNQPVTDGNPNQELRLQNNPEITHDEKGSIDNKDNRDTMPTGTFNRKDGNDQNTKLRQQDKRHNSKQRTQPKQ